MRESFNISEHKNGHNGHGSPQQTPEDTQTLVPIWGVGQALGIISVILSITWFGWYTGPNSGFGWKNPDMRFNLHPVLMTIGYLYLYGNGMLIYRLLRNKPKPFLKYLHAGLNGSAFLLVFISLIAVFSYHKEKNYADLYSLHSWIGLLTSILFFGNFVAGLGLFLYPETPQWMRAMALPFHVFAGGALWSLIIVSILTGIKEKLFFQLQFSYSKMAKEAYIINFYGLTIVVYGVVMGYLLTQPQYKRRPLPAETNPPVTATSFH